MKKEYSCLFDKNVMNPYLGTTIANWVHRIFLPKRKTKRKRARDGVLSVSSGGGDDDDAKVAFVFFSFSEEEEEGLERREQREHREEEEETSSRDSRSGAIIIDT